MCRFLVELNTIRMGASEDTRILENSDDNSTAKGMYRNLIDKKATKKGLKVVDWSHQKIRISKVTS